MTQLLSTASSSELVTNQFQVGLYPFIQNLYTYSAMTTSLTGSISTAATNLASLLDTGVNASLGSGGTHFENAFSSMNTLISSVGTGSSSSSPLPYVFIVTDGSQDYQTQSGGNWSSQNWTATLGGSLSEFGDDHTAEQRHFYRLLHENEEPRHNDRGSLHSL